MQEYWEITRERGIATNAVWAMQAAFALNNLTRTQHVTAVDALTTLADTRSLKEGDLSDRRAERNDLLAVIKDVDVRVPGIIEGKLTEDDDLHAQIDLAYSVEPPFTEDSAVRRASYLFGLWADFNARLAALTPPQTALTLAVTGDPALAVAVFQSMCAAFGAKRKDVADAEREVSKAKTALRVQERKVDRDNKRWYKAWLKQFPAGTPEGDAALSQIPTEQGTPAPTPLEITTATPLVDHRIEIVYQDGTGLHGTTKELLTRLPGESEFGHSVPVSLPSQSIGPYPAGTVVEVRTRLANSNPGVVLGTVKSAIA